MATSMCNGALLQAYSYLGILTLVSQAHVSQQIPIESSFVGSSRHGNSSSTASLSKPGKPGREDLYVVNIKDVFIVINGNGEIIDKFTAQPLNPMVQHVPINQPSMISAAAHTSISESRPQRTTTGELGFSSTTTNNIRKIKRTGKSHEKVTIKGLKKTENAVINPRRTKRMNATKADTLTDAIKQSKTENSAEMNPFSSSGGIDAKSLAVVKAKTDANLTLPQNETTSNNTFSSEHTAVKQTTKETPVDKVAVTYTKIAANARSLVNISANAEKKSKPKTATGNHVPIQTRATASKRIAKTQANGISKGVATSKSLYMKDITAPSEMAASAEAIEAAEAAENIEGRVYAALTNGGVAVINPRAVTSKGNNIVASIQPTRAKTSSVPAKSVLVPIAATPDVASQIQTVPAKGTLTGVVARAVIAADADPPEPPDAPDLPDLPDVPPPIAASHSPPAAPLVAST